MPRQIGNNFLKLKVIVRRYEPVSVGTVDFHMALTKGAIITFVFAGLDEVQLGGFNDQNVIDGLEVSAFGSEKTPLKVDIESIWGLGGSFLCTNAKVEQVQEINADATYA